MTTHASDPPPYSLEVSPFSNPVLSTIEQGQAAQRAIRLQRYLLEIVAYALGADLSKIVTTIPFEWPTFDGFRSSVLQKKEQTHLLRLYQIIAHMHRQLATSSLEDGRTILLQVVEASRTLNIDPGFTLELMAAYPNHQAKPWKQKRKHSLIVDLVGIRPPRALWAYLDEISLLILQLSPNDMMQKTLGLALEKYQRRSQYEDQPRWITTLNPMDPGYSRLAEFLTGTNMLRENGTWQQLQLLMSMPTL